MAALFSGADAYERLMGRWSVELAPRFLEFVATPARGPVLDVGCGTGSLTRALIARYPDRAITGIDPSRSFLELARARYAQSGATFEEADARSLPFTEAQFDQALALLVIQFVPEPHRAAQEMRRVTCPGGTVAACTWLRSRMETAAVFWDVAIGLDAAASNHLGRPQHLGREGDLAALWAETGLEEVEEGLIDYDMNYRSFDDYWSMFDGGIAAPGAYVATLDAAAREGLRSALRERLLPGGRDRAISMQATALVVKGRVPR